VEVPALDSTNSFALQLLTTQAPDGTVVFTPHQFAGRGQQNNTWVSTPHQNLTFSLILYPAFLSIERIFALNKLASLAILRALAQYVPADALAIKWPNDILVNRRKIAGILIENQLEGQGIRASVVGIGININQTQFPPAFRERTTSLFVETGQQIEPRDIMESICQQFEALYLQLRTGRTEAMDRDYLNHLFGYQEYVEVEFDGKRQNVVLVGVDVSGRLAIEEDGRLRYFQMKEISFCL